jgi:hypothetical protein
MGTRCIIATEPRDFVQDDHDMLHEADGAMYVNKREKKHEAPAS